MSEQLDINEAIKACRFIKLPVRVLSGSEMDSIGGADGLMTDLEAICDLVNATMKEAPAILTRTTALEAERDELARKLQLAEYEIRQMEPIPAVIRKERDAALSEVAELRDALESCRTTVQVIATTGAVERLIEVNEIARAALAKGGEG